MKLEEFLDSQKSKPSGRTADFYVDTFKGGGQFYRRPDDEIFVYTEGVKALAENEGAQWLIDEIRSYAYVKAVWDEWFQVFNLKKGEGNSLTITVEDGKKNVVYERDLPFSDFPFDEFSLWCIQGDKRIIMLPSEY